LFSNFRGRFLFFPC